MKTPERVFVGAFGILLLGVGIYAVLLAETSPVWRYIGGGVLCVLGVNAVYGAIKAPLDFQDRSIAMKDLRPNNSFKPRPLRGSA